MFKFRQAIIALTGMGMCCWPVYAEEAAASLDDLHLSDGLRTLLRTEMREIAGASQAIVMSFVSGDWKSVLHISEQIRASYILERSLSDTQKQELQEKLPDRFKRLDMEFHARAGKLGLAAASENAETVAFHFYRLLETCATCHAAYAQSRFPGFSSETPDAHHH